MKTKNRKWIVGVLVLGLALLSNSLFAEEGPPVEWERTFGGINNDWANSVQQTSGGGYYIVAGGTDSFGAGNGDAYLIETNLQGNLLWQKTFGGTDDDYAYSVQEAYDGGYIVAGQTSSFGAGSGDAYLIKTNSDGILQRQKTFGGINNDWAYSVQRLRISGYRGYIVAGMTWSFGAGGSGAYLIRTDPDGNLLWQKTFGGTDDDYAYSVQQTTDEGYIVAGETKSFGAGYTDAYLIKTDSQGNLQWQKTFGGTNYDEAYSVQQTSDKGYIVAGRTYSFGAGNYDAYLIKTDSQGNLQWQKTFGGTGSDWANSVQQTRDGGYIVAGKTWFFGARGDDAYLIKTDSQGNLVWEKTFGGTSYDYANSVQQTRDGGYIVAGETGSFGTGDYNVYLVKIAPEQLPTPTPTPTPERTTVESSIWTLYQ